MSVLVLICRYVSCQRGDRPFVLPSRVFEPTTHLMDIGDFGGVLAPNERLPSPFSFWNWNTLCQMGPCSLSNMKG